MSRVVAVLTQDTAGMWHVEVKDECPQEMVEILAKFEQRVRSASLVVGGFPQTPQEQR